MEQFPNSLFLIFGFSLKRALLATENLTSQSPGLSPRQSDCWNPSSSIVQDHCNIWILNKLLYNKYWRILQTGIHALGIRTAKKQELCRGCDCSSVLGDHFTLEKVTLYIQIYMKSGIRLKMYVQDHFLCRRRWQKQWWQQRYNFATNFSSLTMTLLQKNSTLSVPNIWH